MKICEIAKTLKTQEDSTSIELSYFQELLIAKRRNSNSSLEAEIVHYLRKHDFPTYEIVETDFEDRSDFIIYKKIVGSTGFDSTCDDAYFYDVGLLIGQLHRVLHLYQIERNLRLPIVHCDLHSGNIICSKRKYIIDFSSCTSGEWFVDLLNIEYEIYNENKGGSASQALVSGYHENFTFPTPRKDFVEREIRSSDESEYQRLKKKGNTKNDHFRKLEESVLAGRVSFLPNWWK